MRGTPTLLAWCALLATATASCAPGLKEVRTAPADGHPTDTAAGWQAMIEGRPEQAAAAFDKRLAADSGDVLAAFGRASLDFDRGASVPALRRYAELLGRIAAGQGGVWGGVLAPVVAARISALLEEVPGEVELENGLLELRLDRLPWQARLELAQLGDRLARRRGEPELLERLAWRAGCARNLLHVGSTGGLPRLDLDAPLTGATSPRLLETVGCRTAVPAWDGRAGAQVVRGTIAVPRGAYQIVLDLGSEGRLRVDGRSLPVVDGDTRFAPRAVAYRVELTEGRHELEVRVATAGGGADVTLIVIPEPAPAPAEPSRTEAPPGSVWEALLDTCRAAAAHRVGDVDVALGLAERLGRRRFVSGLGVAAGIARDDLTRPATFARQAGRSLLDRAVAVDSRAARVWQTLAVLDLEDDHPREAIEHAARAAAAAPSWWIPELTLATAYRMRGLEWDADRAMERAQAKATHRGARPCSVMEAALRVAEDRRELSRRDALALEVARCNPDSMVAVDRLRARGQLEQALGLLRRMIALAPRRDELRAEIAATLLARGQTRSAVEQLKALVASEPRDPSARVRLADAQLAAGEPEEARRTLAAALLLRPEQQEVRRAARALGLPLPLDPFRIDGKEVIRAFETSARSYAAPAVVILDRTVGRVFADGAQLILTHNIVRVQSKDGIERWGEISVPSGAEILALRTHKPDGTTREPEEIAGKESISAPDLAVGDYIEWETLEARAAVDAFRAPGSVGARAGFLGERFFFQSFDAPLDRSEYVVVTPPGLPLDIDRRAGAPAPVETQGVDGARVTTFATGRIAQLFAERSSVPAVEYVPSVRVSSGVTWERWTRFLREQMYGSTRSSPALRQLARTLFDQARAEAKGRAPSQMELARAIVRWATDNIEAADDLREPASHAVARGRGNRLGVVLALARELAIPAEPVLARSQLRAEAQAPVVVQELDDFSEVLVRFGAGTATPVDCDLRLRHAPFGYLPPSIDGARTLSLRDARFGRATRAGVDQRSVVMTIRLDEDGGGIARATEELVGWPALEWAELVDRYGADRAKLRQDFEQRWLGVHFPGAHLNDLQVEFLGPTDGARPSAPPPPASRAPAAHRVLVKYSFVSPRLAVRNGPEMKLAPTFFRTQPGRRFATEPQRSTTLMLGLDVPFTLTATLELPSSAQLVDPPGGARGGLVTRKGGYRFLEERKLREGAPGVLVLRRESELPLMRVAPGEYADVAADLRRIDGIEQQEIRMRLRPPRGATP